MSECEHIHEKIWEEIYGLLCDDDTQRLNDHLAECMECREVRADMEAQQQLLAGAALVVRGVPEFRPPGEIPIAERPMASSERAAEEKPASAVEHTRRRALHPMRWLSAAVILMIVAVGAWYGWFRYELGNHRAVLADARSELQTVEAQFVQLRQQFKKQQANPPAEVRDKFPQLVVTAPTHFHRLADNTVRVQSHDYSGKAVSSQVVAKVVEKESGRVVFRKSFACAGTASFSIPPTLKCQEPVGELLVEAQSKSVGAPQTVARIQQPIQLQKRYASQVTVNKKSFHGNDVVFFRTLTLDQLTLQPPKSQLALSYTLQNEKGKIVKQLAGAAQTNGVGGGVFAVTDDIPDGDYKVVVAGGGEITKTEQPIEIRRNEPAAVFVGRQQIQPGKNFVAAFRSRRQDGVLVPNQPVTVMLRDATGAPTGRPVQVCTDAYGWATAKLALPKLYGGGNAQLEVDIAGEQNKSKLLKTIPVANTEFRVDFFPEGGRLVAGVPNRVYFQVCTKDGMPTQPDGHVILMSSDDVLLDTPRGQGAGVFTMTPKRNETYTLRVTSNGRVEEVAQPFADHPIQPTGVVLSVPHAVAEQGEPVGVVLNNSGSDTDLLLLATCRDYVVGRKQVKMGAGMKEISLPLAKAVKGFVRLTMFEDNAQSLKPIAERLVYRKPAEQLAISITNSVKTTSPQHPVRLQLDAATERGAKTPVWFSAVVVDELALSPSNGRADSPFDDSFRLVEANAISALGNISRFNSNADKQALDRTLGIQGWRRFTVVDAQKGNIGDGAVIGKTIAVNRNASSAVLKSKVQREITQTALAERTKLESDREQALQEVHAAETTLARFESSPRQLTQILSGAAVFVFLALGGLFLIGGLWRLLRKQSEPRPLFLMSMASLAFCFLLYAAFGGGRLNPPDATPLTKMVEKWLEFSDAAVVVAEKGDQQRNLAVTREFARPEIVQAVYRSQNEPVPTMTVRMSGASQTVANVPQVYSSMSSLQSSTWKSSQWLKRYASAKMAQDLVFPSGMAVPAPTQPHLNNGAVGPQTGATPLGANFFYQESLSAPYYHQTTAYGLDFQDTVCWHPGIAAQNGQAQISFGLSNRATTYRVRLFAHDANGRMGFQEGRLVVKTDR